MLEFTILASGSSGNALYIQTETTRILLDAGISGRQLQQRLQSTAGVALDGLTAVLVSHEHVDHVRGLRQVLKQSAANLYTTEGTWQQIYQGIPELEENPERFTKVYDGQAFTIGDIAVHPFAISHDAEEPVMYRFEAGGRKLAVVTDLGYMSDRVKTHIEGCDCYILEANHDVEMLRAGRYPWSLKRRILGDKGHLSNHDAAVGITDCLGNDEVDIYLAHLSEENNQPDLAELTVQSVLCEIRAQYGEQVRLKRTSRYEPTALRAL